MSKVSPIFDKDAAGRMSRSVSSRRPQGSALSEFGPALFIIFFFAIFPVMDVIALGFAYISLQSLNDLQLREAVRLPKSMATAANGPVLKDVTNKFLASVMGGTIGAYKRPEATIDYSLSGAGLIVSVHTTATVQPFLSIPLIPGVPGLSAPATFSVAKTRMSENPAYAMQ